MRVYDSFINKDTFNLEDGTYFEEIKLNGSKYRWEKVNGTIVFTTDFMACPRIAYCNLGVDFIFDLGRKDIQNFVWLYFPNDYLKEEGENEYSFLPKSVAEDYEYKHIEFIENWSKVIIYPDGTFEKTNYPLQVFSVDLKDAYDLLHNLFIKYKKLAKECIDNNDFIPTITGGMDTRSLSALWRDNYKDNLFFVKEVKNDGKDNIELCLADYECAINVANRLGITEHTNYRGNKKTISGMYSINSFANKLLNDPDYICKFIQHSAGWSNELRPFADDLFLQIRHPEKKVMRALLMLLLAKDLSDLPLICSQWLFEKYDYKPYSFYDYYDEEIQKAQEILDYWGEEKVNNILKEDLIQ